MQSKENSVMMKEEAFPFPHLYPAGASDPPYGGAAMFIRVAEVVGPYECAAWIGGRKRPALRWVRW